MLFGLLMEVFFIKNFKKAIKNQITVFSINLFFLEENTDEDFK